MEEGKEKRGELLEREGEVLTLGMQIAIRLEREWKRVCGSKRGKR